MANSRAVRSLVTSSVILLASCGSGAPVDTLLTDTAYDAAAIPGGAAVALSDRVVTVDRTGDEIGSAMLDGEPSLIESSGDDLYVAFIDTDIVLRMDRASLDVRATSEESDIEGRPDDIVVHPDGLYVAGTHADTGLATVWLLDRSDLTTRASVSIPGVIRPRSIASNGVDVFMVTSGNDTDKQPQLIKIDGDTMEISQTTLDHSPISGECATTGTALTVAVADRNGVSLYDSETLRLIDRFQFDAVVGVQTSGQRLLANTGDGLYSIAPDQNPVDLDVVVGISCGDDAYYAGGAGLLWVDLPAT